VVHALRFEIPLHHRDEECALFPLMERRALPSDNIHEILARVALEHATDESFTSELIESLEILSSGEKVPNPEMVGYMLRSFFESYRRHIYWENVVVLPLARVRLKPEDMSELERAMRIHREPGNVDTGLLNQGCASATSASRFMSLSTTR
jgi:hemerythrin-like domain-containing protein